MGNNKQTFNGRFIFDQRLQKLIIEYQKLITRKNVEEPIGNGIFIRFEYPVLTAEHTPLFWRYDLNPETNPHLMERIGINSVFNPGAIKFDNKICLMARVEGVDRKSFFAIAESENGVDNFQFRPKPIILPETKRPDINVYDIRLVRHEDGWIYGIFCTERKDPKAPEWNTTAAEAQCAIIRTHDLENWERLPDLKTSSLQQRNAVLHPEFVKGKYAFYTRPQDAFIETGSGRGIGWALCNSIENAEIKEEKIIDPKAYHTIKEGKNGEGPAPIKTEKGWLHIAHGARNTACGLRYVVYAYMTSLEDPSHVIYRPGGHLIAPLGKERIGDVSNVIFCNGAVATDSGELFIYYASSDTRCHVAKTTVEQMAEYCINTPPDPLQCGASLKQRMELIDRNIQFIEKSSDPMLKALMQMPKKLIDQV